MLHTSNYKTNKTLETYNVSNEEFLSTVFKNTKPQHRPLLVSFTKSPTKAPGSVWSGQVWEDGLTLSTGNNNYFSLSAFKADKNGTYRRQKRNFAALHAIMLDDLGTKVPIESLAIPCSWLLETSPGNYQAGYLLSSPITDPAAADRLMKAIIAADLCDKGAGGPTARLARLPVGANTKKTPIFPCRLRKWAPETTYTMEELVAGFKLTIAPQKDSRSFRSRKQRENELVEIFVPAPTDNAVLTTLKSNGLYKTAQETGWHDITCPWVVAHKSLCTALTSSHMKGRLLGSSQTASVSTRTLFLSSGNNVGPVQDMTRRCITINLNANCEVPASRTFKKPDLIQYVKQHRSEYVTAALTIVLAWTQVKELPPISIRAISGFHPWTDWCRNALLWLGLPDPADSMFISMEDDPDRNMLVRLISAWHHAFQDQPKMVRHIVEAVEKDAFSQDESDLHQVLYDIAGESGGIKLAPLWGSAYVLYCRP